MESSEPPESQEPFPPDEPAESQNIDLSGPASAEALRIADALLRESFGSLPSREASAADKLNQVYLRVKWTGEFAHLILLSLSLAVSEVNLQRMRDALDRRDSEP